MLLILVCLAAAVNGLLAGASLDQSIEQLPARHRIGVRAYSDYSRASHLANGRFWLIPLGIGGPALTVAAAIVAMTVDLAAGELIAIYVAAALSVAHGLSTVVAARLNLTQWRRGTDDITLVAILDRFERWQAVRASLQFLTFAATIWTLAVAASR